MAKEEAVSQLPPPILGLIVPYLSSTFLSSVLVSVEMVARIAGYTLSLAYTEFDWGLEHYHINQFLRQGVSGIILYPGDHGIERRGNRYSSLETAGRVAMLQQLQQREVPFILLDRYVPEIDCDYVVNDDRAIGYTVTQHLVALGHEHIGFVSIDPPITSSAERYAGYEDCLHTHALPIDARNLLQSLHWSFITAASGERLPGIDSAGYQAVRGYLQREDRPSAVVVLNDTVAWCVIQAAEEVGLRVPEDLAVVCCGGGNPEVYGRIPLSSITQPGTELGRQGAYLLLDRIERRSSAPRHIVLSSDLVIRRSSGTSLQLRTH
jgi:DNA-binding LacI/PurR family transcriptional regulator